MASKPEKLLKAILLLLALVWKVVMVGEELLRVDWLQASDSDTDSLVRKHQLSTSVKAAVPQSIFSFD